MNPITAAFEPVLGIPSWSVRKGHGSFVTMEFGDPELTVQDPRTSTLRLDGVEPRTVRTRFTVVHGAWHLWIYCCLWRIEVDGVEIAHCESDDRTMARSLGVLNGQALTAVDVHPPTGGSRFTFDLGAALLTHPAGTETYGDEPMEQWLFYQPSGQILTVRGDGHYSEDLTDSDVAIATESRPTAMASTNWKPIPG